MTARGWGPLHRLDQRVAVELNDYIAPRPGEARFWRAVSGVFAPGVLRGVLLVLGGLLLLYRRVRGALLCFGVSLGSLLSVSIVKWLVDRPRPDVPMPVAHAPGAAFPSGHAFTSAAVALTVIAVVWRSGVRRPLRVAVSAAALSVAAAVGFSRMVLGVHYLTDVLGGWLGATALVCALIALLQTEPARAAEPEPLDTG